MRPRVGEIDEAFPVALAVDADAVVGQVDVFDFDGRQFADADAGGEQQFQGDQGGELDEALAAVSRGDEVFYGAVGAFSVAQGLGGRVQQVAQFGLV